MFWFLLLLLIATPIGIFAYFYKLYTSSPCYTETRKRKLTEAFMAEQSKKG